MTSPDLLQRLQRLEDIEAIKQLKSRFCYAMDSFDTNALLTLFTEDTELDYRPLLADIVRGHAGIAQLFDHQSMQQWERMARHQLSNPLVEIDGDRAYGKWYMFGVATLIAGNTDVPIVEQLIYEDTLLRVDGEWKIHRLQGITTFVSPQDEGWVKTPMFDLQAHIDSTR